MPSLVSVVLLIPSFNVLSGYFYVSLTIVAAPTVGILINFATQLLSVETAPYPSPKPTLTLISHIGQNVGLGAG